MTQVNFQLRNKKLNPGYIYILQNPSFPNLLKIGKTTRTPTERASELSSSSGIPTKFNVVFDIFTTNCDTGEKEVHEKLKEYRAASNREFFELTIDMAKETVIKVVAKHIENEIGLLEETTEEKILQFKNELESEIVERKKYLKEIKPVKTEQLYSDYNQPVWFDYPFIKHNDEEEREVYEARRTTGTQRVIKAQRITDETHTKTENVSINNQDENDVHGCNRYYLEHIKNSNHTTKDSSDEWLWALLLGPFYFIYKRSNLTALLSFSVLTSLYFEITDNIFDTPLPDSLILIYYTGMYFITNLILHSYYIWHNGYRKKSRKRYKHTKLHKQSRYSG